MPSSVNITVSVLDMRPPWMTDMRQFLNLVERALGETAVYWFTKMLPMHFGQGASDRYAYQNRNRGYMIGKYVGKGRSKWRFPKEVAVRMASSGSDPYPLEYSGRLKQEVLAGPPDLRTRGITARIILHGPPWLKAHRPGSPYAGDELTRVTPLEREELNRVFSVKLLASLSFARGLNIA